VREQRVTNLLQSLLLAVCLGITPAIQLIPTAVLWGYFIFMAAESLAGSQLWERLLVVLTDPQRRVAVLQQEHAAYLQVKGVQGCRAWWEARNCRDSRTACSIPAAEGRGG
jgi:hypothetical protein